MNRTTLTRIMEATISNFRGGRHTVHSSQMILVVKNVHAKDKAKELVGKNVTWTTPSKKRVKGKIIATHGNSGAVRAKFERGMPGQSLGTNVKIE